MDGRARAVRRRVFGRDAVDASGALDPHRVILSWLGVSTFAASLNGHAVLLDAWVPRGTSARRVPVGPDELAHLQPDAILIGHGHVDHAGDLVRVLRSSDAVLVGAAEHLDAVAGRLGYRPGAVLALPQDAPAGATAQVSALDGVELTAVRTVHSALVRPRDGWRPFAPRPAPGRLIRHRPRPTDLTHLLRHLRDPAGPSMAYHVAIGDLTLFWHDTTGPLPERAPAVLDALRGFAPVDVHVGAIQGWNQLSNGLADVRLHVEALRPRVFVPNHHDDWLPPLTAPALRWAVPLRDELGTLPPDRQPEVRFLADPRDYVRPSRLTFPVDSDGSGGARG
jgi:L-ascorbate metabolism protein UlaG (beta-lactamase superfamily)